MWGTVGSGLTPGTPLGRRTSEIPDPEPEIPDPEPEILDPEPENPEKPENRFRPLLLYYGRTRAPTDMVGVSTDRS